MLPGPDQIIACPHCEALQRRRTLLSGNTFGSRAWTDGARRSPMLPATSPVAKCQHCSGYYWTREAKVHGEIPVWGNEGEEIKPEWASAPYLAEPKEKDYYAALQTGLARSLEEEKALRILAWWRRNDRFRDSGEDTPPSLVKMSRACRSSLLALATLLDTQEDTDRIMRAEVLREMGDFRAGRSALLAIGSTENASVVGQIIALCDANDPLVREIR